MSEITLQLPEAVLNRLQLEADRQHVQLDDVVLDAIQLYLRDDEPSREEVSTTCARAWRMRSLDAPTPPRKSSANFAESILPMTTTVDSAPPFGKQLDRHVRKYPKVTMRSPPLSPSCKPISGLAIKSPMSVILSTKWA